MDMTASAQTSEQASRENKHGITDLAGLTELFTIWQASSNDAHVFIKHALKWFVGHTAACAAAVWMAKTHKTNWDFIDCIGLDHNKDKITSFIKPPVAVINNYCVWEWHREDAANAVWAECLNTAQCQFLLGIPLLARGKVNGILVLQHQDNQVYTDLEKTQLLSIASYLSLSLEGEQVKHCRNELSSTKQRIDETQDQLLQSEKLASIGQLAAGVAHEINNPIGYISSNLGSLKTYVDDLVEVLQIYQVSDPLLETHKEFYRLIEQIKDRIELEYTKQDLGELVSECQEGIKRVKQIVQDLKDFSHVDEGEWEWNDLHKGLDSTLNIVHNELKYTCEIQKEYGDIPLVECNAGQINQVFMNLLVNAGHAIKGKGLIILRTRATDTHIQIEVQDNGCGIEPDKIKSIFDPFFTTKPVGKGTGLGLSLSYGIVQKHNGTIEVESVVGEGTKFTVTLPIEHEYKDVDND